MRLTTELTGIRQLRDQLKAGFRETRKATARGLTKTAIEVRAATVQEMRRVFNNPTTFTLGAFEVKAAEVTRLASEVGLKRNAPYSTHFLTPQVLGGSRSTKRFERALVGKGAMPSGWFAVPTGAALDGSGKVRKGLVQQIVAQASGQSAERGPVPRFAQRKKADRTKRLQAQGRAGGQFVFVQERRGKLAPGIYLASGRFFGARVGYGRSGGLVPMFRYTRTVQYRPRLEFFEIAERIVAQRLRANIESSLAGLTLLRA